MRIDFWIFGLMAASAAAPAAARCFDASDLEGGGLVATYRSGDSVELRRGADGVIRMTQRSSDRSPPVLFLAHQGIYLTGEAELGPDGRPVPGAMIAYDFPVDPGALPAPGPGVTWSGEVVDVYEDGLRQPMTTTFSFAKGEPLTLGGCTYGTLVAGIRYDYLDQAGVTHEYLFLPRLGAGLYRSTQWDGEERAAFEPVSLERADG